jgi:hypothetical protein
MIGILLMACATTGKPTGADARDQRLDDLVAARTFSIAMQWASPMITSSLSQVLNSGLLPPGSNPGRIDIQGSNYYVAMHGDSVAASLPYFGERQRGGGYGTTEGITFKGLAKDLSIEKSTKRQSYEVHFRIGDKTESYQVWMTLFAGGNANVRINSTDRFTITYDGVLQELDPNIFAVQH